MTNPFTKLSHWLQSAKEGIRESNKRTRVEQMNKSFYVEEKNGHMYLMHNGVAIHRMTDDCLAMQISDFLRLARETAVEFEYN